MKTSFFAILLALATAQGAPLLLHYEEPAEDWQLHSLPIGNGNLGAMIFGGVAQERIMFNEDSLWLGDENDTGAYQAFGDIFVNLHDQATPPRWTASAETGSEGIAQAIDDNPKTKWCVENRGAPVTATVAYGGKPVPLTEYSFVSANDMPARDPKDWEVQGSHDGRSWQTLDTRNGEPVWEKRGQARTFKLKNTTAWPHYRFVFRAVHDSASHFQLADIVLNSKAETAAVSSDYRRELDLDSAVHRVSYRKDGITFTREAFASYPAGVMVFRFSADKPGAYSGSIELNDAHDAKSTVQDDTLIASGDLTGFAFSKNGRQAKHEYGIPALGLRVTGQSAPWRGKARRR